jgi:hypothetical protein
VSVIGWVIIAIVGIVAALFGLDRYRGSRKNPSDSAAQPTGEVFHRPRDWPQDARLVGPMFWETRVRA